MWWHGVGCWVVDEEHVGAFLTAGYVAQVGRCIKFDMAEGLESSEIYLSRRIMAIYLSRYSSACEKWHLTRTYFSMSHDCLTANCPSEKKLTVELIDHATMWTADCWSTWLSYLIVHYNEPTQNNVKYGRITTTSQRCPSKFTVNVCETNRRSHDGHG